MQPVYQIRQDFLPLVWDEINTNHPASWIIKFSATSDIIVYGINT